MQYCKATTMPAIITITFNPALDKSVTVPAFVPEKKLHTSLPVTEAGGGGINVARAIKKLGGHAKAIYLAGGTTGDFLAKLLDEESVLQQSIHTRNDTRENITVTDSSTQLQYRLVMPGPQVFEEEWQKLLQVLAMQTGVQFIIASGSLPPGVPTDIFSRVGAMAKQKGARFIVDTSGIPLKMALNEEVFLLKPSINELCSIVGVTSLQGSQVAEAAAGIISKGKCQVVVVSLGAEGALLVTKNMQKQFKPPVVKAVGTVGAGDSMVAGIVYRLYQGATLEEAVQYGIACGTAATLHEGTSLCNLPEVEMLYATIMQANNLLLP